MKGLCLFVVFLCFVRSLKIDNFKGFTWYNNPKKYQLSKDDKELTVISAPISDYWRKTWYGFIRDSGPFFYTEIPTESAKNLTMTVGFDGFYTVMYDQSGLMIRLDEKYWLKTGIEFDDNSPHASAVVTNDYSDWNVVRLANCSDYFYIKIFIDDINSFEISYSVDGGKNYQLLRIGRLPFDEYKTVKLGVMTASPGNKDGFTTKYKDFSIDNESSPDKKV